MQCIRGPQSAAVQHLFADERLQVSNLQAYAASLDLRIADLKRDALRANKEGQKNAALVHMRRMKRCQVARDNRLSSLYTLEAALDQVCARCVQLSFLPSAPRLTASARVRRRSLLDLTGRSAFSGVIIGNEYVSWMSGCSSIMGCIFEPDTCVRLLGSVFTQE